MSWSRKYVIRPGVLSGRDVLILRIHGMPAKPSHTQSGWLDGSPHEYSVRSTPGLNQRRSSACQTALAGTSLARHGTYAIQPLPLTGQPPLMTQTTQTPKLFSSDAGRVRWQCVHSASRTRYASADASAIPASSVRVILTGCA